MSRRLKAATESQPQANNSGSVPKRISIDGVLKIMWNKIGELENEIIILKEQSLTDDSTTSNIATSSKNIQPTSIFDTEGVKKMNQLKIMVDSQERRLHNLETQVQTFTDDITKSTGTVKTDLEYKYNQLNNLLVELQTTQMVMNNKVLKQFNDVVEKNAEDKFRNASIQIQSEDLEVEGLEVEQVQSEDYEVEQVQVEPVEVEPVEVEQVQAEKVQVEKVQVEPVEVEGLEVEKVQEEGLEEDQVPAEENITLDVA